MIKRRVALVAAALVASGVAFNAAAEWPEKPITMIVPWKAGGTTETKGQVLSKAMAKHLGQKVVVQTKPGGGAAVGATYAARQKNDGYTIMYADLGGIIWNPMSKDSVKFKASDFDYIAGVSEYQIGLVTRPDMPFKTLPELIAYTKTKPLNVADMGGISKAVLNYIAAQEGVKWTPIPTRGGGEMIPFILGKKGDFAFSGGGHQKYGDKRIVRASFMATPLAKAPNAPSIQDLYGISMAGNSVVVVPKGVSDDIQAKLEAAVKASMDDPDFERILENIQFPKRFVPRKDMPALVDNVTKSYEKVLAAMKK